jgi:flotillin
VSEALDSLHTAWGHAGENAVSILLIEDNEKIMRAASEGVGKIKIENLSIMDSGDGKTLTSYVAAYPQMLASIFDAVTRTTGIDIPKSLSGKSETKEEGA